VQQEILLMEGLSWLVAAAHTFAPLADIVVLLQFTGMVGLIAAHVQRNIRHAKGITRHGMLVMALAQRMLPVIEMQITAIMTLNTDWLPKTFVPSAVRVWMVRRPPPRLLQLPLQL
jgi:hypothetical protein